MRRTRERRSDHRRRAAVDIALSLAELNAGWGDYDRALEHLAAADELTGGSIGARLMPQREAWIGVRANDRRGAICGSRSTREQRAPGVPARSLPTCLDACLVAHSALHLRAQLTSARRQNHALKAHAHRSYRYPCRHA